MTEVQVDMRCFCAIACVLVLAGCGQESIDLAEKNHEPDHNSLETTPGIPPQISPNSNREETPNLEEEISSTLKNTQPSDTRSATTLSNDPPPTANPEDVISGTTKKVPSPEEEQLSPSERIARKLISNDPEDNLGVLNEALERWLTKKGALPERVSDLVAEQFLPMLPMAPEGKVFVIDPENRRVVLIAEK